MQLGCSAPAVRIRFPRAASQQRTGDVGNLPEAKLAADHSERSTGERVRRLALLAGVLFDGLTGSRGSEAQMQRGNAELRLPSSAMRGGSSASPTTSPERPKKEIRRLLSRRTAAVFKQESLARKQAKRAEPVVGRAALSHHRQ